MRLADFIETNTEPILAEWVSFASQHVLAGESMNRTELRDHALEMLHAIVADLRTPQTGSERVAKSMGLVESDAGDPDTAAEVHGAARAESGFTVGEMVSEYRALRASVIRLWTKTCGTLVATDLDDLMRFNEAIDQALAESITRYALDIERSREMFVAILGHDLRTPLGAVMMASQFMLETGELDESQRTLLARIHHSGQRMNVMVGDLLDFTRSQLGAAIPIHRAEMDLAADALLAVEEVRAAHPESTVRLTTSGNLRGQWDAARLGQVLSNLLGNAVAHAAPGTPIDVSVRGDEHAVVLQVCNQGRVIPQAEMRGIFSPFKRLRSGESATGATSSLGLGLYIAERIVTAHAGTITVTSSKADGTTVAARLPR